MIVPDEESLHWRLVRISFEISERHLDLGPFASLPDLDSPPPWTLKVGEDDPQEIPSFVSFSLSPTAPGDDARDGMAYLVEISTFREPIANRRRWELSYARFFALLRESIRGLDEIIAFSITELTFPADRASWRMKLLAEPPELGGTQSGIGPIALSGVRLRFTDSPAGLLEASLDTSPAGDEYRCELTSVDQVDVDAIAGLHSRVLEQAEEFASLFIDVREGS